MKIISFLGRFVLQVIGGFIVGGILVYIFQTYNPIDSIGNNSGDFLGAELWINIVITIISFLAGFSIGFVVVWLVLKRIFKKNNSSNSSNNRVTKKKKNEKENKIFANLDSGIKNISTKNKKEIISNDEKSKISFSFFNEFLNLKKRLSRKYFFSEY